MSSTLKRTLVAVDGEEFGRERESEAVGCEGGGGGTGCGGRLSDSGRVAVGGAGTSLACDE